MKINRFTIIFATVAAFVIFSLLYFSASAFVAESSRKDSSDERGHVLVAKWKKYDKIADEDLPATKEKILGDIISEAADRRLSWDFYDALEKYHDAVVSRNWKMRDSVRSFLAGRVADYGDVLVSYSAAHFLPVQLPSPDEVDNAKYLRGRRSPEFYANDRYLTSGGVLSFPDVLLKRLSSDYEYLLWSYWYRFSRVRDEQYDRVSAMLDNQLEGRYPEAAFKELVSLMSQGIKGRKSRLESFVSKYEGRAVSYFAKGFLLDDKFSAMSVGALSGSDDFKSLKKECEAYISQKSSFKGEESALLKDFTVVEDVVKELDSQEIMARVEKNTLKIFLRNIPFVEVSLKKKDESQTEVLSDKIENPRKSYYKQDTLTIDLSNRDDGEYVLELSYKDEIEKLSVSKYTVSAAARYNDGAVELYAADYITGRPVPVVSVRVMEKEEVVWSAENVALSGMTALDKSLIHSLSGRVDRAYISCSYVDNAGVLHCSRPLRVYADGAMATSETEQTVWDGRLLTSVSAVHPGDSIFYKAVLYFSVNGKQYGIVPQGESIEVSLHDSQGVEIDSDVLDVNDFGSVSGGFEIPKGRRNGFYRIVIKKAGAENVITMATFLVDEFVAPTYQLKFEPQQKLYFIGDKISVSGVLKSYSSHPLSSAKVTYRVSSSAMETAVSGDVSVGDDGRFVIEFPTETAENGRFVVWYHVLVRVSDATGETKEFSTVVSASELFYIDMTLDNEAESELDLGQSDRPRFSTDSTARYDVKVLDGDFAVISFDVRNSSKKVNAGQCIDYEIVDITDVAARVRPESQNCAKVGVRTDIDGQTDGNCYTDVENKIVAEGHAVAGEKNWIDLSAHPSGVYRLRAKFTERGRVREYVCDFVKVTRKDHVLDLPLENLFRYIPSRDSVTLQIGAGAGPVWAVVTISGDGKVLASRLVHLDGKASEIGSLKTVSFRYEDNYPDVVKLDAFYFRNERIYYYSRDYRRVAQETALPLTFSRFTDKADSGQDCHYELSTLPGVECAVTVYDKALEQIRSNFWSRIHKSEISSRGVSTSFSEGYVGGRRIMTDGVSATIPFYTKNHISGVDVSVRGDSFSGVMEEETVEVENVEIRFDFNSQLAFYPLLRSDEHGKIRFSFEAGDKLSEYCVSVFAHDKSLKSSVIQRTMTVSLPVRLSVVEPLYLYEGDTYKVNVSVSNVSDADSQGIITAYFYDGVDYEHGTPMVAVSHPLKVAKGVSVADCFETEAFEGVDTLGLKIVYRAEQGYSDGVFVKIPVKRAVQTITEAHSAMLLGEESKDSLYARLRDEFVNVSGYGAEAGEISIYDMLLDGVREFSAPNSGDAVDLSSALYMSVLKDTVGKGDACVSEGAGVRVGVGVDEGVDVEGEKEKGGAEGATPEALYSRLMKLRNVDGGFAWFEGMRSSQVVTAVVLERLHKVSKYWRGVSENDLKKSLQYIDNEFFKDYSAGVQTILSFSQYLYIRSLYADYELESGYLDNAKSKFKKDFKKYFQTSENSTVFQGYILGRARRAATVSAFESSGESAFLRSVGQKVTSKVKAVYVKDMESLKEYAVEHVSGGVYYPNAVMPFRGLLESELYAHSFLSELMASHGESWSDEIADGLRLWMMVQKETQHWDSDAAYCEALSAVSKASDKVKSAKVLTLKQSVEKPFEEIEPSGNAMSVRTKWYRQDGIKGEFVEISSDDTLKVGDKVKAVCEVWSRENRSFVRLSLPRYACLRPQNQLSGYSYRFGYREVKSDRTLFYLDVLPEEKTMFEEVFFVTQSGVFTAPVVEVESMYANYFRANDKFFQKIFAE